ncbi:MAG: ATP-dependent DNA helicase RecQ [Variovorax sp.]|nr:MAG: ATP-dependent DNA helicase RecQ [Variovorax sp.]
MASGGSAVSVQRLLRDMFGLRTLRPGQREVIDRILSLRSTLAIMPTGAGKSLCYQIPAMLLPGCTVVVSPLIALMNDQCEKLRALGVHAVQLNSQCSTDDIRASEQEIVDGKARIILTTPERFATDDFIALLRRRSLAFVVVDEAHCIAQWGHDFRPAYLALEGALVSLGQPPVLALTATASGDVAGEIMTRLKIPRGGCIDTGAFRANLRYRVEQLEDNPARRQRLLDVVAGIDGSGIVYTATVREAVEVHAALRSAGEAAGLYHGRCSASERQEAQEAFMRGKLRVMVATNAFGMGIDKADIRFVVHCQMPANLDAYYQESGRAGRDGNDAHCVLLFLRRDKAVQNFFKAGRYPEAEDIRSVHSALAATADATGEKIDHAALAKQLGLSSRKVQNVVHLLREQGVVSRSRSGGSGTVKARLQADDVQKMLDAYKTMRERDRALLEEMVFYAQTGRCRWQVLLDHLEGPAERPRCGSCDNCVRTAEHQAAMAQSIVLRDEKPAGQDTGFARGATVKVKRYGEGVVTGADGATVTIEFQDGSRRCFHPAFVQAVRSGSGRRGASARPLSADLE